MRSNSSNLNERRSVIEKLIDEFTREFASGESLEIEQFISRNPEYKEELIKHFSSATRTPKFSKKGVSQAVDQSKLSHDDQVSQTLVPGCEEDTESETNIPKTFGRYNIQKVLGMGAMGAVYLARDSQLDRDVALKIPKFGDHGVNDEEMLTRFYREARASATLRSPYICPVYDVGEIDGQHYITMAYIEGRPLKDFTKSKKKTPGKTNLFDDLEARHRAR
jgi:hypothetical protein